MENYAAAKKNKSKENFYELIGSSLGHIANQKEAKFKSVYKMLSFSKERKVHTKIYISAHLCKKEMQER